MERFLILGHTGFVGGRLKDYFQNNYNDIEVIGLSTKEIDLTNAKTVSLLNNYFNSNTSVILCSGIKSDYGNNLETYKINLKMAENICKILEKCPVKKFIFFSSLAVYGVDIHNVKISEKTEIRPDTYYGLSKYASEQLLKITFSKFKTSQCIIIRTPTIYGPYEKICAHTPSGFLNTYLDNREVTLWGDGLDLREFIYVDDIVKIVNYLILSDFSGVINIGTGTGYTYKKALDVISKRLNKKLTINSKKRTKEKIDKLVDPSLLNTLVPKFKFTSLDAGIEKIINTINNKF